MNLCKTCRLYWQIATEGSIVSYCLVARMRGTVMPAPNATKCNMYQRKFSWRDRAKWRRWRWRRR